MILKYLRPSDLYIRQWTNHHWFRWWLVAWSASSHYLNQCWYIVNSNLRNKLEWNLVRSSYIFIQENAFENVCEMAQILSRHQCVNCSCMVRLVGCLIEIVWGFNLLSPERYGFDFERVNFENIVNIRMIITLEWMPEDFVDIKSTLVQAMAWYRQASSHYLNQFWRTLRITRPQCVDGYHFADDIFKYVCFDEGFWILIKKKITAVCP